jgi:membrane protein CcdC involved in cytochrome C biogenesis
MGKFGIFVVAVGVAVIVSLIAMLKGASGNKIPTQKLILTPLLGAMAFLLYVLATPYNFVVSAGLTRGVGLFIAFVGSVLLPQIADWLRIDL